MDSQIPNLHILAQDHNPVLEKTSLLESDLCYCEKQDVLFHIPEIKGRKSRAAPNVEITATKRTEALEIFEVKLV